MKSLEQLALFWNETVEQSESKQRCSLRFSQRSARRGFRFRADAERGYSAIIYGVNIAILGASGRLGRRLVRRALEAGHRVVAYVRFPIFLRLSHKALTIIKGDSKDETAVERALSGVEAVMTVLGPDAGIAPDSTKRAARAVILAMKRAGVRRLIWQTGWAAPYMGETLFGSRKAMRSVLGLIGTPALKSVEEGLRLVMQSDLDCTVVRFNRIERLPPLLKLPVPWKSSRPKSMSPDEAAGIMLAQIGDDYAPGGEISLVLRRRSEQSDDQRLPRTVPVERFSILCKCFFQFRPSVSLDRGDTISST